MKLVKVSDASVLLTALFGTNDRVATRLDHLLHDTATEICMLPYTAIEFANGVRFSTRNRDIAKQALTRFTQLKFHVTHLTPADIMTAVELSYRLDTTVYDTSYHHVAIMQDGVFITCDRNYYKKASHLGHIELWE